MKILLQVQATSKQRARRGRPSTKAVAAESEEKFLELDVGDAIIMVGFPDDERTRVAVERAELEKALKFILSN